MHIFLIGLLIGLKKMLFDSSFEQGESFMQACAYWHSNKFVEIDFVCRRASEQYYIQVAYTIGSDEKARQELRPFTRISDAFRKIVITMDTLSPYFTEEGIYVMSIFDFLRNQESMTSF